MGQLQVLEVGVGQEKRRGKFQDAIRTQVPRAFRSLELEKFVLK